MPFPLAHPAAVLPLRRFCPKLLSFPALAAGSVCPDLGYIFGESGVSDFSHTLIGGTAFGIGSGCLLLGLCYFLRNVAVEFAPAAYQEDLRRQFQVTARAVPMILLSLAVGTWTHLLLDSFTHSHGWFTEQLEVLRAPIFALHGKPVRVCHLLWYLCSFAGLAWLVVAIRRWQASHGPAGNGFRRTYAIEGVLVALLVLPIEILHHFVHSRSGLLLVAAASLLLSMIVLARPLTPPTLTEAHRSR